MPKQFDDDKIIQQNDQQIAWYCQAVTLITHHMYLKCFGTMILIGVFFAVYFYVLSYPAYPITVMPITFIDELITFQPITLPIYLSLWLYVSLPPALLATKRELLHYALAMTFTSIIGFAIFYFWPTTLPLATIDWPQPTETSFLKGIDAAGNACPSFHVATAFFSGCWLHYLFRRIDAPPSILVINWLWCIAIVYSTLAIRQHVVVDVVAGLALGGLMAYLALQYHKKQAQPYAKPRSSSI